MNINNKTYKQAGVDRDLSENIKQTIARFAKLTHNNRVVQNQNNFAGYFSLNGFKNPVLVSTTDNVGTKIIIAKLIGHLESIGIDLVNLNINDLITSGAVPLFFLDYISVSELNALEIESIVRGISWACHEHNCPLLGGETAQQPGLYSKNGLDLAGFVVGALEKEKMLDPSSISIGDCLIGLPSNGLHTNGFSLVRKVFNIDNNPKILYESFPQLEHSLGEELLRPHKSYFKEIQEVKDLIRIAAHISGGGISENLSRLLPEKTSALIKTEKWDSPPIFNLLKEKGNLVPEEMFKTFNMGIGMILVSSPENQAKILDLLPESIIIGNIRERKDTPQVCLDL